MHLEANTTKPKEMKKSKNQKIIYIMIPKETKIQNFLLKIL